MGWPATKETLLNQPCNGFTPGLSTWLAPTPCWWRSVMLQYWLVPPVDDGDGSGWRSVMSRKRSCNVDSLAPAGAASKGQQEEGLLQIERRRTLLIWGRIIILFAKCKTGQQHYGGKTLGLFVFLLLCFTKQSTIATHHGGGLTFLEFVFVFLCKTLQLVFACVCLCTCCGALLPHKMGVGWPSLSTTGCLRPSKEHRPCSSKFRVTLHSSQVLHFPSSVYNAFIQIFSMYFSYFVLHTIEPYE